MAQKTQKYFPHSGNTIIHWLDEIIAYFDNRTTSGVVEVSTTSSN
jgi:transposase